jgi:hypothetical protein
VRTLGRSFVAFGLAGLAGLAGLGELTGCGAPTPDHGSGGAGGHGGASGGGGAGGSGGAGGGGGGPTFASMCNGAPTTISGTVFAPNGHDPIANALVYVPSSTGQLAPGVSCDLCVNPVDGLAAHVATSTDGTFRLDISQVPMASQLKLTVNKGRFRRATTISIQACKDNAVGAPNTVLPSKSGPGDDIPKIAVSTGIKDALDDVLNAMGLDSSAGYDCFENQNKPTTSPMSVCEKRMAALGTQAPQLTDLLKDINTLSKYNIIFVSCALGKYASLSAADRAQIVMNLQAWVGKGGRLFTTDRSYDYVAQAFPAAVSFFNGDGTVDAANVGVGSVSNPATYAGRINDPALVDWLTAVKVLQSGQNTLPLTGYLTQWSAVQSVPMSTVNEVDATDAAVSVGGSTMTGIYPQTIKFDYPLGSSAACGRVVFSSYHTTGTSGSALTPQEKILEYLMFEAGACLGTPIS